MASSQIEWTDSTWNPVTGCTKVSPGCKNCYAERMANRLRAMGQPNYKNGFELTLHEHVVERPLSWKKPQVIFVNSMSDLFHEEVPAEFIFRLFNVMEKAHWHHFQILTKRAERLEALSHELPWPKNIWMGVSVEDQTHTSRINHLRRTPAAIKFLSVEPLLGPIKDLNLDGIQWVIVGGESGPRARPLEEAWVVNIRDLCVDGGVPFFFKQWGGFQKKRNGRVIQGRTWDEMPEQVAEAAGI